MKITYRKPEVVELTGLQVLGVCTNGSGDEGSCTGDGISAGEDCSESGLQADFACDDNGNQADGACRNDGIGPDD